MITIEILETLALPWVILMQGQRYTLENSEARALIASGLAREIFEDEKKLPKVPLKRKTKNDYT